MKNKQDITIKFSQNQAIKQLSESRSDRVLLRGITGSALSVSLVAYSSIIKGGAVQIIIMDDRDSAAYLSNDLTELVGEQQVLFFPSTSKRSVLFNQEELSAIVLRTSALSAMAGANIGDKLYICTYPEAVGEKVITTASIESNSIDLRVGESVSVEALQQRLIDFKFTKVDFVYEPGNFSVRGGIVDIFSYSENQPFRIDFFGDEIDSIRRFDISSQRSIEKLGKAIIVPYIREVTDKSTRSSFFEFVDGLDNVEVVYWLNSPKYITSRLTDIYRKYAEKQLEHPENQRTEVSSVLIGGEQVIGTLSQSKAKIFCLRDELDKLPVRETIEFNTSLQPSFNKNFELLAADIDENYLKGYQTYILTQNKAQVERLENIFNSLGKKNVHFENIPLTLHDGFVDHEGRSCYYTDHQIFERFHKYKINREIKKSESVAISELNALNIGDYVVHIDHGVCRFGGLVRSVEGNKSFESIKLTFRDNDILLVNVHSLHKISKYKDKDNGEARLHKLGSGVWQRFKETTKSKVKDIAKDLIALYAKRRTEKGFAFSANSYLQNELEASFIYEDTPDQEKATQALYKDMESSAPMDRLVCGDVGFGKTEIAIRAAFKAVCDNKQVAVLVPTTVLSLQHYRTFSRRLKEFPVRVENLSRAKSPKQVKEILEELVAGKIDILIGTHKILGKDIKFKDLGLLIIDEEQKFGVSSKEKLKSIKANVDTMTLTATPIPRTLQFSLMGARDLSVINTPPPNRQPVNTEVHQFSHEIIKEAIDYEVKRGGQVFMLHNRVKTIEHIAAIIQKMCPDVRCVIAHGQMPPAEMEKRMMDFIYGEYDVLIATTIIESGIDIPTANTMIINDAQNFGLSDLHQLRGRVGRTNIKAHCYLLIPDRGLISETAHKRIKAIEDFSELGSGFNIAMQDLDIRGAGNILGAEQSGFVADIGFETYYKILNEAMVELKNDEQYELSAGEMEDGVDGEEHHCPRNAWEQQAAKYVDDCQIDTDSEAVIPDSYITTMNEKINIYKQIDRLTSDEEALRMKEELVDRFGKLPKATEALFAVVLLRRIGVELGFDKIIVKNGYFIIHFVNKGSSSYYESAMFGAIMRYVGEQDERFKLKQRDGRLLLSIAKVASLTVAYEIACRLKEYVKTQILG